MRRTVYLRTSPDGGKTWSGPVTVNDDASTKMTQHYDPNLTVAPNGRLDIDPVSAARTRRGAGSLAV
ncbi:MAG: glycoside hydrolase [Actinomycetota bacterium]|nr:glycoside hydrolase [Actinomycetota bacterium]